MNFQGQHRDDVASAKPVEDAQRGDADKARMRRSRYAWIGTVASIVAATVLRTEVTRSPA